ncbi:MAG: TRAP transporter small permease [Bacillota bacterium]
MQLLIKAKKVIQRLTFYVCAVSMFMLVPMMFLTTIDVIGRAFFARPVPGAVELSEYMLAVVILLGLAYTQQVKGHPRVNLIVSRLPLRLQSVVEIIINLLGMFIVFIVIWQGWVFAMGRMSTIVSDVLRIPQLPFRILVSVGAVLLFLELLVDLSAAVGKLFSRSHRDETDKKTATRVR